MTHYRTRLAFVSQGLRVPGRGGGFTASGTGVGDVQDDQQEVPAMPNTGAGGLAGGIPVGGMAAASTLMLGAANALGRR